MDNNMANETIKVTHTKGWYTSILQMQNILQRHNVKRKLT